MTQKYYNFEKLTPDKDADISVYEEAIEFVFDNSDVTNIAISGAYGAGKSSVIESYEKKHDNKNFLHISLAHFEPTERNESEDSVKETTLEGKILNQLIHQIPVDRIPQTNFRVKKDVGRRNIIIITILLYVLLGSITFISMSNKIQNWVDALCDGRLKSLLAIFTNDFTVFFAAIALAGSAFICIYNAVKVQKNKKQTRNQTSACKIDKKCGGCQFQKMPYKEQLKRKQKQEEKLLGGFCKVSPIIGMEHPYFYRNKVHAVFDHDRKGNVISGIYAEGTHRVIAVEECLIEDKKSQEIIRTIRELLPSFKIKTYNEDTGYGLLRHVLIRRGFETGEIMVVLVLGSPILPSKNNFVKALRKVHPEITTVVLNVNNKQTSMVLGEKEKPIYGPGFIKDRLCGCTFRISPKSFYQVNPVQTEILYNIAMDYAELTGKETVIDAYCGTGTIGLIAARNAKRVIGVELNKDAVKDARINAKENGIKNAEIYAGDAGRFMVDMASKNQKADVVFMDPPRAGSDEKFLSSVIKLGPKRVVYVSCNPETLARDLKYLTGNGYQAMKIQPVDNFPFCDHIETVVKLVKKR